MLQCETAAVESKLKIYVEKYFGVKKSGAMIILLRGASQVAATVEKWGDPGQRKNLSLCVEEH